MLPCTLRRLAVATLLAAAATAHAQADDPMVSAILADISAQRIEQRIRTLVDFGTRHTESETASDTRGIGAARRWIERELRSCSRACASAAVIPSVTKWKVVPPSMTKGARAWLVSTNTGT